MEKYPKDMMEKMKATFDKIDVDHDGRLSKSEIQACVKKLNYELPEADYEQMFKQFDPVGQMLTLEQAFSTTCFALKVLLSFLGMDTNNDGRISFEEMKEVTCHSKEATSAEERLREVFNDIDKNKDGFISFEEYLEASRQRS